MKDKGNFSSYPILVVLIFAGFLISITAQSNYWEPTTNFTTSKINDISIFGDDFIFVATEGDGIFLSSDQGDTWMPINNGLPNLNVNSVECTNFLSPNNVFAGGNFDSLYRKTVAGSMWEAETDLFIFSIYRIIMSGLNIYVLSNSNQGIFRSTDNGDTWQGHADPLWGAHTISSITTNPIIFAGSLGGGVFRSNNFTNWVAVNNGLFNDIIYDLDVDGNGKIFAATMGGVYSSTDNGDNWVVGNNGLPQIQLRAVEVNSENYVFVGTSALGVAYSTNSGADWIVENSGLTELNITDLELNSSQRLFAGTSSGQIFRTVGITNVEKEDEKIPLRFYLDQNYPNPFNPTTTINFSIPEATFVSLKIFNSLGEEIQTLISEELSAGNYNYDWNAINLPSGIYFYKIHSENFIEAKKMILLK